METSAPRAKEEAIAGQRLNHPNIVRTFEFVEQGDEAALEYVEGKNLAVWLGRQGGAVVLGVGARAPSNRPRSFTGT